MRSKTGKGKVVDICFLTSKLAGLDDKDFERIKKGGFSKQYWTFVKDEDYADNKSTKLVVKISTDLPSSYVSLKLRELADSIEKGEARDYPNNSEKQDNGL